MNLAMKKGKVCYNYFVEICTHGETNPASLLYVAYYIIIQERAFMCIIVLRKNFLRRYEHEKVYVVDNGCGMCNGEC